MKPILILTIILLSLSIFGLALGSEELNGKLYADFGKEEIYYSEVTEYDVEATATVSPNLCNYCLQNFNPSECLTMCSDIIIYD